MFEKLRGFKVVMVAVVLIALLTAVGGLVISRWDQQSAISNLCPSHSLGYQRSGIS